MKILAIETSGQSASAAILKDKTVLAEAFDHGKETHSQKILGLIDQVLKGAQLDVKDLGRIAVSGGPGSFTGLRIGLSTALGLAKPFQVPVLSISTLKGLVKANEDFEGLVCPLIDARRNQVYTCLMKGDQVLLEDSCLMIDHLADMLQGYEGKILLVGDGAEKFYPLLQETLGDRLLVSDEETRLPRARDIGLLGLEAPIKSVVTLNYVRKAEAERRYEEEHGRTIYE